MFPSHENDFRRHFLNCAPSESRLGVGAYVRLTSGLNALLRKRLVAKEHSLCKFDIEVLVCGNLCSLSVNLYSSISAVH